MQVGLTLGLLSIGVMRLAHILTSGDSWYLLGIDRRIYQDAAIRFIGGGSYFLPSQLAGPHVLGPGEVLYPPVTLWLLVPFAYLPDLLWWAVPIVLLAFALCRMHPRGWALPAMAALLTLSNALDIYWLGQPTIWLPVFVAFGLERGGWAVLVLLKPSLFPFALIGIRRRSWWITALALVPLSLAFGLQMWRDWFVAIVNITSGGGLVYSASQAPLLLIPVVAWLARDRIPRAMESGPATNR